MKDVRWRQRFSNYVKALEALTRGVQIADERPLTELEQQGLIQGFEFTHELAWNVLKDYLDEQGVSGVVGSRGATREAYKNGLIEDGDVWMEMIRARNLSSHTYNPDTAAEIVSHIRSDFFPALQRMARRFAAIPDEEAET